MNLSNLLSSIYSLQSEADRPITGLALDSRSIQPKQVFIALKGTHLDGRQFISSAMEKGASAVLLETDAMADVSWQQDIPIIPLPNLKQQLGPLAARYYAYPAQKLHMMGVTGTSGKTSCTHFIAQLLQQLNIPCGLIGTLGSGFYGALADVGLTTPDAIALQARLQQFVTHEAQAVAMEVSSHSIDQGRVNGIDFALGIFTNLSQDHLDYHHTMDEYAAVKRRFLAELSTQQLIINADDAYGRQWIAALASQKPVYAFHTQALVPGLPTTVQVISCTKVQYTLQGIQAWVHTPWGEGALNLPLIGAFNLSNALAVLTALCVYGIPLHTVLAQLATVESVAGRMQTLGGQTLPLVVVDYAHKPDALEKVLQALRTHTKGKLYCVFGCGGERDRTKRPLMAQIAERLTDGVIVTNDNPRHENPAAIAAEIMQGFSHPERVKVELDRARAIANGIQWASAEDCVLIAGKGAEQYQQIGDEKLPFDDVTQVEKCLRR